MYAFSSTVYNECTHTHTHPQTHTHTHTLNKKKHNLLKEALQKQLKGTFEIVAEGAGLAILINPTVAFDWEKFKAKAEEKSIKLYLAKERCGGEFEAIRLGFGGFLQEEIVEAVEAFSEVWKESII